MQFGSEGGEVHEAKVSARYGGLKYLDADRDDVAGTFCELGCTIVTNENRWKDQNQDTECWQGLEYFYSILGVYDAYNPGLELENQSDVVYDIWER